MKSLPFLLAAAFLATQVGNVSAQIDWTTTGSITGASNISTTGKFVAAIGVNDSGNSLAYGTNPIQIGDTYFDPLFNGGNPDFTVSGVGDGSDGSGSTSSAFQTVLDGVFYAGFAQSNDDPFYVGTVTLNNLHPGDEYQVQVFNAGSRQTDVIGSDTVDLSDSYAIGDFTATTSSESFTFRAANNPTDAGELGAVVLRDVPEPSTYAMMLGGLALLGICVRRKLA
jgi:hypothetical protein